MRVGRHLAGTFAMLMTLATTSSLAQTHNTGMADPVALTKAFDKFLAGTPPPGSKQVIPLTGLRGLTTGTFNAGGHVTIDLAVGSVVSEVRGLPAGDSFDLWLIDNQPGGSTLVDSQDVKRNVGTYTYIAASGVHGLTKTFTGFTPDRAFVVRSGLNPTSFVLTGSSTVFDRLFRRQV